MTRVKKGVNAIKNRRNTLKKAKGYIFGRSKKERAANEAVAHAGAYAFAHRRKKKRDFRTLWNIKINAACRLHNRTYSGMISDLRQSNVALDRKMLADLAENKPHTFERIVQKLQSK